MLRWGSSAPVATSSSIIDESSTRALSLSQQHHDETSSSSPEPQEPTGALLVDDETDDDEDDGQQMLHVKKSRGDKRKRAREEDSGGDHVEPDDDEDEADSEDLHPAWHPQNIQSTTEFTHIIADYANKRESGCKKAEYSEITVDDHGNRWRLIIYVNGNGRASNHHLSLFLQVADADDLPFGWKKSVSYVLTLEHPNGSTCSYAKRNPDKTFKLCPKAIDWGWSQFITSDRIQQEGFVSEDSLRVRASVTVKSSSVSIDEEDAELYLKCAVEEGDADAVELCLENGASVNCQFKDDLYTPLHTACSSGSSTGSMEVLEILLERGADCNACNKWRETPLLIAANNGHRLGVASLLKHGADPSLCSEAGWSALTFAAHKGYDDIVALLLRAGAPVNSRVSEDLSTPLHKACAGSKPGHLASVKLLLDATADVHALNKWRETPLLTAANHGQAGAVEVLLSRGADPCRCTDTGWSPLSIAAYKGHDEVVRLLLEEGAPTEEDDPTLSALLQAATKGLPDTVELLLRHGADHTVTTKKGDTALSILVEQNLIDAAVEMVTHYSASIPRCSRDRKKVQRARLLINLRMKQLDREGKDSFDEDEDDSDNDGKGETTLAQHVANGFAPGPSPPTTKKKGKSKISAEAKAKAAEEELLQELAKEEEEARKEEAEANKKLAKKRKKKERERQQKMKDEQERREKRERQEQEERERERARQEKEELERKEREKRMKEEQEREMKEMMKREKTMLEKRKVKERRERQRQSEKSTKDSPLSPKRQAGGANTSERNKPIKTKRAAVAPTSHAVAPSSVEKAKTAIAQPPQEGNRRWETKGKTQVAADASSKKVPESNGTTRQTGRAVFEPIAEAPLIRSSAELNKTAQTPPRNIVQQPAQPAQVVAPSEPPENEYPSLGSIHLTDRDIEPPSVVVRRKEKVEELLLRGERVQGVLDATAIKRIVGRWVARAHHGRDSYIDPIIPSWTDNSKALTFFQRQFISESRRLENAASIETLKDAGSAFATLCQEIALDVYQFSREVAERCGDSWADASVGLTYQPSADMQTISWDNNRFQVSFTDSTLDVLQSRFKGPADKMLSALFAAWVHKETVGLVLLGTGMDLRLSPTTQNSLASELEVSVELNSDAFSALPQNSLFGAMEEVDGVFGGLKPFTKDECVALRESGGSCSVLLPFENTVASQYVGRMLDLVQEANVRQIPLSFAVFVSGQALPDPSRMLSSDELRLLDSRLETFEYNSELIPRSVHGFWSLDVDNGHPKPALGDTMLVVLQSEQGKQRFRVHESTLSNIVESMGSSFHERRSPPPPLLTDQFRSDYNVSTPSASPYFLTPESTFAANTFSEEAVPSQFSAQSAPVPPPLPFDLNRNAAAGATARRGRLFDLVDNDVEEDSSVDLVAGMLDKLDVGLFQNNNFGSADVDIEAISLMGINTAPRTSSSNPFG